jgi:hypothetical protein
MCEYLTRIIAKRVTKQGFQDYFLHEIFDLLNDSDIQVWLQALDIAVTAMEKNYFTEEQFEYEVAPCFVKQM